jgi:hypothetical protein
VTIRGEDLREGWAVAEDEWPQIRAVIDDVSSVQRTMREDGEAIRLARLAAIERARQPIWHVVRRGEAVLSIANRYGTSPERLRELNRLTSDRIRAGDSLLVKPRT